jgi:hypothetical protein
MAELVNLRRARKARERVAAAKQAEANRQTFGRTKTERALSDAEAARAARDIEGKKLDR